MKPGRRSSKRLATSFWPITVAWTLPSVLLGKNRHAFIRSTPMTSRGSRIEMDGKNQGLWNWRRRRKGSGTNQVEGPGWMARLAVLPGPGFTLQQDVSVPRERG